MRVFVKNMKEQSLMPCSQRKARVLLKEDKAKIYSYNPFTIQLLYQTGESVQQCSIGIDTGSKNIGIAIMSSNKVLAKAEIELRQDVKDNLTSKKILRRNRRNRKTRYRKARFLNRGNKKEGWLPPSIESRIQNTFNWIDKFCNLVPKYILNIEVGKFDVQKMLNPNIKGKEYQEGNQLGYYDVRHFVFARDSYTCQICKKKSGILVQHHIIQRKDGGSNRADNLVTLHNNCHIDFHDGKVKANFTKLKQYKEPPFMNSLRTRIFRKYPNANITYGSITKPKRKELGLEKTHYNDAIAISNPSYIKENFNEYLQIKQFRKKKRSLHESIPRKGRKVKNTTQKRNSKNTKSVNSWILNDKVRYNNKIGFITGFTGKTGCYIKDIYNNYIITPNKSYKQVNLKELELVSNNNNWSYDVIHLPPI